MGTIAENVARVRDRIAEAAGRSGRRPEDVRLIAVTKTVPVERVREALDAGLRDFGENYVQEALPKIREIGETARWHFVGHLQSNKAKFVVGTFALVHSVDSVALARELDKRAGNAGVVQDVLIEVRLDPAETKTGVEAADLDRLVEATMGLPHLRLRGLMGMPPFFADPEQARPYFRRLKELSERLPTECGRELSMGMSADFEVAVEEGATMVRVGTAIFGPRS